MATAPEKNLKHRVRNIFSVRSPSRLLSFFNGRQPNVEESSNGQQPSDSAPSASAVLSTSASGVKHDQVCQENIAVSASHMNKSTPSLDPCQPSTSNFFHQSALDDLPITSCIFNNQLTTGKEGRSQSIDASTEPLYSLKQGRDYTITLSVTKRDMPCCSDLSKLVCYEQKNKKVHKSIVEISNQSQNVVHDGLEKDMNIAKDKKAATVDHHEKKAKIADKTKLDKIEDKENNISCQSKTDETNIFGLCGERLVLNVVRKLEDKFFTNYENEKLHHAGTSKETSKDLLAMNNERIEGKEHKRVDKKRRHTICISGSNEIVKISMIITSNNKYCNDTKDSSVNVDFVDDGFEDVEKISKCPLEDLPSGAKNIAVNEKKMNCRKKEINVDTEINESPPINKIKIMTSKTCLNDSADINIETLKSSTYGSSRTGEDMQRINDIPSSSKMVTPEIVSCIYTTNIAGDEQVINSPPKNNITLTEDGFSLKDPMIPSNFNDLELFCSESNSGSRENMISSQSDKNIEKIITCNTSNDVTKEKQEGTEEEEHVIQSPTFDAPSDECSIESQEFENYHLDTLTVPEIFIDEWQPCWDTFEGKSVETSSCTPCDAKLTLVETQEDIVKCSGNGELIEVSETPDRVDTLSVANTTQEDVNKCSGNGELNEVSETQDIVDNLSVANTTQEISNKQDLIDNVGSLSTRGSSELGLDLICFSDGLNAQISSNEVCSTEFKKYDSNKVDDNRDEESHCNCQCRHVEGLCEATQSHNSIKTESLTLVDDVFLKDLVDQCGFIDAFRLSYNMRRQRLNVRNMGASYRIRTLNSDRFLKDLDQLKRERMEGKRQLRDVNSVMWALKKEAKDLRASLADLCDTSVLVVGANIEAKSLEPVCYKKYTSIKSLSDAVKALAVCREHIKALYDLEVLIYRQHLVLLQTFSSDNHQPPVPTKRANRSTHKMPRAKKNEQTTSGQAGNIVIEIVASEPELNSWPKEIFETESPLTISTLLSLSHEGTASSQLLTDTEI